MSDQGTTRKPTAGRRQRRTAQRWERAQRHAGDRGGGYSPSIHGSSPWTDPDEREHYLGREVDMLRRAPEEHGGMKRGDLGRPAGGPYVGPGPVGQPPPPAP